MSRVYSKSERGTLKGFAECLAHSPEFLAEWLDTFGVEPVESRMLQRLKGCPFPIRKGSTMIHRQRLAQGLRLLADDERFVCLSKFGVGRIERVIQANTGRRLWRLVVDD